MTTEESERPSGRGAGDQTAERVTAKHGNLRAKTRHGYYSQARGKTDRKRARRGGAWLVEVSG